MSTATTGRPRSPPSIAFAASAHARMSTRPLVGLAGVSMKIIPIRPLRFAPATASSSVGWPGPAMNPARWMPNCGRTFSRSVSVPPYIGSLCTTTSPGRRKVSSMLAIAPMPLLNTALASARSQSVRRSSRISMSGLLMRE